MRSRTTHRARPSRSAVATLVALALTALVVLSALPHAFGQTVEDQVAEAGTHAEELATDAAASPGGAVANATDPSWQGRQVNWTLAWTCDTAVAVDEDAGQTVRNQTGCPEAEDASAGDEPDPDDAQDEAQEANETVAEAEEAENDTATAVEDETAAAEAFLNATTSDPGNADEHLLTFVNRTLVIVDRLLSLPREAVFEVVDLVEDEIEVILVLVEDLTGISLWFAGTMSNGFTAIGDGLQAAGTSVVEGLQAAGTTFAEGFHTAGDGLQTGAGAAVDATTATVETTVDGVRSAADALADAVRSLGGSDGSGDMPAPADRAADRAVGDATGKLDGVLDRVQRP